MNFDVGLSVLRWVPSHVDVSSCLFALWPLPLTHVNEKKAKAQGDLVRSELITVRLVGIYPWILSSVALACVMHALSRWGMV